MLVVLGIISLLLLLFVPNLSQQKDAIQEKGNAAVVKVVESQMELYELEYDKEATVEDLQQAGYITEKQAKQYATAKK
ncbi:TPA: competence protein ComG [Streptococcus suis]|uniref:competence type IV pilus major pilin ComGC n=2 Tax=Streptococcus TaxID=1301 RepID=UPI001960346B|nr:competence type IV pilus major pilin ComGC [Streptococcus suis]MBM7313364.1 competence protein ComG [Streptococcus suis]HEP1783580.1 competence protein ComG [Streptococcus suis]